MKTHKESGVLSPFATILITGLIGLILLYISFLNLNDLSNLSKTGIYSEANIIAFERRKSSYFPIFEFLSKDNHKIEVRSRTSFSELNIGDKVNILYNANTPYKAIIVNGRTEYFWGYGLAFMGALVILVGFSTAYKVHKERSRT